MRLIDDDAFDEDDEPSKCYGTGCENDAVDRDVLCAKCRAEVEVDVAHEDAVEDDALHAYVSADHDEAKLDDEKLCRLPKGSIPWNAIIREV